MDRSKVNNKTKVLIYAWVMKRKASVKYRDVLNMRGYELIEVEYYDHFNVSSHITKDATICIILVLMVLADFKRYMYDM